MVYESDFYTTRRPYTRPISSHYSVTNRDTSFPWEKVPFVPRPSLVSEPFTVWGRKKQQQSDNIYQYTTIADAGLRKNNPSIDDHTRQLIRGGTVTKIGVDAATELASRGHVFENGILSRKPGSNRHAHTPSTGRTKILMALHTPSWYRF